MLVIDCHVHSRGEKESANEILKQMDKYGIDKIILFSPYPGTIVDSYSQAAVYSAKKQEEVAEYIAKIQKEDPDRIIGFLWLEPRVNNAISVLEKAICDLELKGVKMIPYHWYPYEERMFPIYEKIEELGVPILFHSGILFGFEDSSRYCRPTNYEVLIRFPKLKFALAHISWPWVDECIALWGRFRAASRRGKRELQMYIDATPGTPPIYREDALRKVFAYGAGNRVLFGSDSNTKDLSHAAEVMRRDLLILRDKLGMPPDIIERYFGRNALEFLGIRS
ncbi:MAG: hypothetical protein DRZ82_08900 [Thermoprotei archaeon]|nr:MAG: hypothetical protein DRZ82_08900 [Thermoprotei archaeon]